LEAAISIQDLLPLREPTFYILLSLAKQQKHGYAILKEVEALSESKIILSTGTLYGALTRLQDQGLIERVDETDSIENGRVRKAYRLTEDGQRVLNAEVSRLQSLVKKAQSMLPGEAP
jgi:DNA-binding PadR family transcriptional regulator